MKRVSLRQRQGERWPAIPEAGKQVNGCEEDQGGNNQDKFDLNKKAFEDGVVLLTSLNISWWFT